MFNKKIFFVILILIFSLSFSFAQDWHIIPWGWSNVDLEDWEIVDPWEIVEKVSNPDREADETVWSKYDEEYNKIEDDLWTQFATGIMGWNTILNFAAHLVNRMSNVWLVIWALMIIYSWYIYASAVITGNSSRWSEPVKNAIIWIVIIIFSYAIMRIITYMFL